MSELRTFLSTFILLIMIGCGSSDNRQAEFDSSTVIPKTPVVRNDSSTLGNNLNYLKSYTYRVIFSTKDHEEGDIGSGFFISNNSQTFLITARHLLYDDDPVTHQLTTWKGFEVIDIRKSNDNKIRPLFLKLIERGNIQEMKINGVYADLVMINIKSPEFPITYTNLSTEPSSELLQKGTPVYIVGYPSHDDIKIVRTRIFDYSVDNLGHKPIVFELEDDAFPGLSGSPVFVFSRKDDALKNPIFLGEYTGFRIHLDVDKTKERGTIVNGYLLR